MPIGGLFDGVIGDEEVGVSWDGGTLPRQEGEGNGTQSFVESRLSG